MKAHYKGQDGIHRAAEISACGKYRYWLTRIWDKASPMLVVIGLNPSKADALVDDATIRVCMGRARRMGCGGLLMLNLFAYRATKPADMMAAKDPIGPRNTVTGMLRIIAKYSYVEGGPGIKTVIAAWGDGGLFMNRADIASNELCGGCRVKGVHGAGLDFLECLGTTKAGMPKHPLRIAYSVKPEIWSAP